jgi:hypothetical protein
MLLPQILMLYTYDNKMPTTTQMTTIINNCNNGIFIRITLTLLRQFFYYFARQISFLQFLASACSYPICSIYCIYTSGAVLMIYMLHLDDSMYRIICERILPEHKRSLNHLPPCNFFDMYSEARNIGLRV